MKRAVNQWCFPEGTAIQTVFEQANQAGLEGVELNLYSSEGVGLTLETNEAQAKEMLQLAARYDVELKSLSTGLMWQFPLSSADANIRMKALDIVKKQLELAAVMDMEAILVVPGLVTKDVSYDQCYNRSQEALFTVVAEAEKLKIKIGIENVWNKFLLSPLEMARYIDEFNSPWVACYFDVGNVLQFGFPEDWIRYLGKRICKVHVKDFSTHVGNITGFVPLLAGDVDWKSVREALAEIGYDDYLTAELSPYGHYPNQMIRDTAHHLSRIVAGI